MEQGLFGNETFSDVGELSVQKDHSWVGDNVLADERTCCSCTGPSLVSRTSVVAHRCLQLQFQGM